MFIRNTHQIITFYIHIMILSIKYILITFLLIGIAGAIRQNRDTLLLPDSSQTLITGQKIQVASSSFSPLYLHVFEYDRDGPVKHVNLTDQQKGLVLRIESFELLEEKGDSIWLAFLKQDNDDKIYVCELEDALKTKEVKLLK
jgi:hypothetical protein